jgi:phosphoribosylformylglycinamidine synthase subunit PurS
MKFKAKINITLREGILDVQGKAVESALHSIEFPELSDIRIGKYVELFIDSPTEEIALERIDKACKTLIANPIIEDYSIKLEKL